MNDTKHPIRSVHGYISADVWRKFRITCNRIDGISLWKQPAVSKHLEKAMREYNENHKEGVV